MPRDDAIRYAISQGFYMNTCRRTNENTFLSVRDGTFAKICRESALKDCQNDYVIYTELSGAGESSFGLMKMISVIDVKWVADLIPNLKDKIDV